MSDMPMNPHILALLHFARQQEQRMINRCSEDECNTAGTPDHWTVKDYLANIMHWKELQRQKLAAAQRGEVPPTWKETEVVHQITSQAFAHYQNLSFQEIEEEAESVFNTLIAQVECMSEEELNDINHYPWQEGDRLRGDLLGNGFWYPCDQLTALSLQRGDRQFAFDLQKALVEEVRHSTLPSEAIGIAIYNRACFCAENGWPEEALALLPEALQLKPNLIEWSRHDPDLDRLREDPAFQAVLADPVLLAQAPVSKLISPQDLEISRQSEVSPFVIDVRGSTEYLSGHVEGAVNIPLGQLALKLSQIPHDRSVITYCNMHHRGASRGEQAATLLREQGYQASTLDGGYPAWKEAGLPVEEVSRSPSVH